MANSGLARMAKRQLDRLNMDMRRKVQVEELGQIFIWNSTRFKETMKAQGLSNNQVDKIVGDYRKKLKTAETTILKSKGDKKRLNAEKEVIRKNKIAGYSNETHELFAVRNYSTVSNIKTEMGALFEKVPLNKGVNEKRDSKIITGRLDKGDVAAEAVGEQTGHGEFGHAVSTTKVFAAESVMKTKGMQKAASGKTGWSPGAQAGYQRIESAIKNYKDEMGINTKVNHHQHITARGAFKKSYTVIMSGQLVDENQGDAKKEAAQLKALKDSLEGEYEYIVHMEGSDTLIEAIASTTVLGNLAKSKAVKVKRGIKPKKVSKSTGTGKASKKVKTNKSISTLSGSGAFKVAGQQATRRTVQRDRTSIVNLIGILSNKIENTVAKNMGTGGRLVYRSGDFARSVEITDVAVTPQGFPSIGYTYDKYPYQTFEPGYAQGSPERDPRRLIDASIREIAMNLAIGRFYTRRV